ncbi:hypothetical protein SAMN02949497_3939 [Methylomagnum ishizawai]|uniref:Uncharacterized protein n=1 Tax=Methylomagnum ishizawai TaxID=1760988 RepID=A0A1Y6D0S9_9GAMM|nr:hypothetical protein SAMN02949497_3939 [Methylomagnum ishizawai]
MPWSAPPPDGGVRPFSPPTAHLPPRLRALPNPRPAAIGIPPQAPRRKAFPAWGTAKNCHPLPSSAIPAKRVFGLHPLGIKGFPAFRVAGFCQWMAVRGWMGAARLGFRRCRNGPDRSMRWGSRAGRAMGGGIVRPGACGGMAATAKDGQAPPWCQRWPGPAGNNRPRISAGWDYPKAFVFEYCADEAGADGAWAFPP